MSSKLAFQGADSIAKVRKMPVINNNNKKVNTYEKV